MPETFIDPFEQFVEKRLLIISSDASAAAKISYFAALLKGKYGDDRVDDATVRTLKEAHDHIKLYPLNIIFIDPTVDAGLAVLDFVQHYRINKDYEHIVWVVFSDQKWWQQNEPLIQSHPWGKTHFAEYYKLFKNQSENELYRDFVIQLTLCHWDFVLKLLDRAANHIRSDAADIMTQAQIKKYSAKGIALLRSLTADRNQRTVPNAFVSMTQSAATSAQYKLAMREPLEQAGYTPFFAGAARVNGQIPGQIFSRIRACSVFVGDITDLRPSVLMEVGYALAMEIPLILVRRYTLSDKDLPFLIATLHIPRYDTDGDLRDLLVRELKQILPQ